MKLHTQKSQATNRKSVLSCALTLVSITLLSSCSMPHDYTMPPVKSAQEYEFSKTIKAMPARDWPNDMWWERYQDPQLNQLIEEALEESPTMHIAEARLKNAAGIARQIGALQKIQVSAAASASLTKVSYEYQSYMPPENLNDYGSLLLDFAYEFDFWDKNKASVAAATSELAAAEAEQAASKLLLSTSVANSYAELARLHVNLETVNEALDIRRQTVELLTKRYEKGLENKGAVSQATSAEASVEAELLRLQESIELQKNAIAALLGKGPDRGNTITSPGIQLADDFGLPPDTGVNILGHRPDVAAARLHAEAAGQRIGVARAQFYPNVSISAFIGLQAFGLDNLFKSGNDAENIGPALYLPIFSGGRLQGQLTSAEATYEQAVSVYNATLVQALHDVADAVTSTRVLDARIQKTQQAVEAAHAAHQIANNRYAGGLARYLDVLTAEDALLESERALANLESRAFNLDIALIHALGGGYQLKHSEFNKDI
jgi:NodT family efflux transporter outer membrane factor (OMF) lipoprotein